MSEQSPRRLSERCVWCGATAMRDEGDGVEWVMTLAQAGCDHELLERPR